MVTTRAPASAAPPPPARKTSAPTTAPSGPVLLAAGPLEGIRHRASDRTALYETDKGNVLRFEDVDIEGTPGPYVYLVELGARTPDGGVPLGPLTAERGSFGYALPADLDVSRRWTVLVWCRPYDTPIAASDHR